jgi:hypothetical protein
VVRLEELTSFVDVYFLESHNTSTKKCHDFFFNQALREDIPKSHLSMDPVSASVPLVVATQRKISPFILSKSRTRPQQSSPLHLLSLPCRAQSSGAT